MSKKNLIIALFATVILLFTAIFTVYVVWSSYSGQDHSSFIVRENYKIYDDSHNPRIATALNELLAVSPNTYQITDDQKEADLILSINQKNNGNDIFFHEPYVPVINNQTVLDSVSINSITNLNINGYQYRNIAIAKSDMDFVTNNYSISSEKIAIYDDYLHVIDQVNSSADTIGFIPFSLLSVKVRPLTLDQISPFKEPDNYPVQIKYSISGQNVSQFINTFSDFLPANNITEVLAVGDIMMGRYVGVKINRSQDNTHSFTYVADALAAPDITFAQLETPLAPTEYTSEGMILVAQPETVAGLEKSGIDLVSLSGNHFGDALSEGMLSTFATLDEHGIKYFGAGRDQERAFQAQIFEKNGTRFGFISFVNIMPDSYGAGPDYPGSAWVDFLSLTDQEKIVDSLQQAAKNCDVLIAGFHWGTEYTPNPTSVQQQIAHLAIDNGADIVIGTHPHVVQADEIYQNKYIIYSLGNFIMDQMWSEETQEGVLLYFYVMDDQIISYDLVPTHVIDYSQVQIISKEEGENILQKIWDASSDLSK